MESEEQTDDTTEEQITEFLEVQPTQAFEYDVLTITGEHIDTTATYTVTIGNLEAPIIKISETELKVQISEGTTDGPLQITGSGINEIVENITILRETGTLYAIVKADEHLYKIVTLDEKTGVIEDSILYGPDVELDFTKFEYAPSINSLVIICDSRNSFIEQSYGLLNLDTGIFSVLNPISWKTLGSSIEDIEISSQGRVFATNHRMVFELDITTGEVIENSTFFYSYKGHPSLQALVYSEFEGKVASGDLNIDFNQSYLNIYDLNAQSSSVIFDRGMSKATFNKDTGVGFSLSSNGIIYRRLSFLQPGSVQYETGLESNPNYDRFTLSYNSDRLFFIAEDPDNITISYLGKYHIPTNSFNQAQMNELVIDIDFAE